MVCFSDRRNWTRHLIVDTPYLKPRDMTRDYLVIGLSGGLACSILSHVALKLLWSLYQENAPHLKRSRHLDLAFRNNMMLRLRNSCRYSAVVMWASIQLWLVDQLSKRSLPNSMLVEKYLEVKVKQQQHFQTKLRNSREYISFCKALHIADL